MDEWNQAMGKVIVKGMSIINKRALAVLACGIIIVLVLAKCETKQALVSVDSAASGTFKGCITKELTPYHWQVTSETGLRPVLKVEAEIIGVCDDFDETIL